MAPIVIIIGCVICLLVWWLDSATGRGALRFVRKNPALLLPALFVWVVAIVLRETRSADWDTVWFSIRLSTGTFALTTGLVLSWAAHLIAVAWLLWGLSRRMDTLARTPFVAILFAIAVILALAWLLVLLVVAVFGLFATSGWFATMFFLLLPLALVCFGLNLGMAPLAATLALNGGRLVAATRAAKSFLKAGGAQALIPIVLARLILTGLVTIVWLADYSYVKKTIDMGDRGTFSINMETITKNSFEVQVNTTFVLDLTTDNAWLDDIAEEIEEKADPGLEHALGLLTCLLSTVFIVACAAVVSRRVVLGPQTTP